VVKKKSTGEATSPVLIVIYALFPLILQLHPSMSIKLYENADFFCSFVRWNVYGHVLQNPLQRVCWGALHMREDTDIDKYFSTSIEVYIMAIFMRIMLK